MSVDISDLGAADLGRMYERGSLSPVDVVLASLDKAERYSELNVFVNPPDRERILAEARQSEARWRNNLAVGKLDGVPITVKDTIDEAVAHFGRINTRRSGPAVGRGCAGSRQIV